MCFHRDHDKSNSSRFWMRLGKYLTFDCELCRNLSKLEKLEFCGKFSIFYAQQQEYNYRLQSKLIKLEEQSNNIQCEKCKQKFHLQKKGNNIFVSTFICIHQNKIIIKCKYCRKLTQKKQYQRCKKCQISLFFFDENRKVICPSCNMVYCECCKKEHQLFSQQFCRCKIIKSFRDQILLYFLLFLFIGFITLFFTGSYYLEHSEYYQSIVCTIRDGYSNINCTWEQFYEDTFYQLLLFILIIFMLTLIAISFESVPYMIKLQNRIERVRRRYE